MMNQKSLNLYLKFQRFIDRISKTVALFILIFMIVSVKHDLFGHVPPERGIKIMVAPDHLNWTYRVGEQVNFSIMVFKDGNPLPEANIAYEIGPEKSTATKRDSLKLANGQVTVSGGSLSKPGFLRCIVICTFEGVKYRNLATAGIELEHIEPTIGYPTDFEAFWVKAKSELSKIPLDPKMRMLPERCTGSFNVYEVSFANINKSRMYGILCVPKKDGKHPAVLVPPGAGVAPIYGETAFAERGIISLAIDIHGIPATMDPGVYQDLSVAALKDYSSFNLDSKDSYYYKRVYLGCLRALDFLTSLPEYDGVNLATFGTSQGGALSIVSAALDRRVKVLGAVHPALCDLTGFLNKRAGGWPQFYLDANNPATNAKIETMKYYDVVNFAKLLKVQGIYSWGFNDEVCPPTSLFSAYNGITSPKQLILSLETGHYAFPETYNKMYDWLQEKLKANK